MSRYVYLSFFCSYYFIFFIPFVSSQVQLPEYQRNAMTRLSHLLANNTPWSSNSDPNPCTWKGVSCTTNSSITHLSLSGYAISTSSFLQEICQLDSLQSLDLSNNSLTSIPDGFITSCGKMNGLNKLNISQNRLSGSLPTFNGFQNLESLDLSQNFFNGSIDLQLDGLVALKSLNLSLNTFAGSLPSKLGRSLVLEELQVSKNNFSGEIPEDLFMYKNLTLIDVSLNQLSGPLSNSIGQLSKLTTLLLFLNNITGQIPNTLSNIVTLSRLSANQNQFSGTIPKGISQFLRSLDLSYNLLTGFIPTDLLSPPNLESVDLSYNSLQGLIPSNVSSAVFRLRLGSNRFIGSIPIIATLSKLTYLELDNNSLSGQIPVVLATCKYLALLNLARNNLSGPLPKELGNLTHLQVLKLQSNKLTGQIPGEFMQLRNLSQLNISVNFLTGSIPSDISNLGRLMNLNLQDNQLTGSIPTTIADLNSLLELQLGKNFLSGTIPKLPLSLQIALNLSNNQFKGPIPDTLRLPALEVLDISNNGFTGEVPTFLTEMPALTKLLLSRNQLSGVFPSFRPYVNFDTSGNTDLIFRTPGVLAKKTRFSVTVTIVVAVFAAAFAVAIVGVIVLVISRRFYRVNDGSIHEGECPSTPQVINGHLITPNSIHKSGIDFKASMEAVTNPTNILLKTRFSTYYKAVMPGGTNYHVKKLNWADKIFQMGSHDRFEQELELLGRVSNSNIMIPLAYVLTVDSAYIFYEYAEKGTLLDAIHGRTGDTLDWGNRYTIAVGVAQGLAFLHGCTNGPILLLDLSSRSILLKSLTEPKIGDIELCKIIDPSKNTGSLSAIAGSVGYIPPEYAYTMRVTMAGNVYSLGVILLELLTGKPAVSEGTELAKWVLSNTVQRDSWSQILDPSVSKASLAVQNQMLSVLKIALNCVSVSPDARPKIRNVLRMLINAR